MLIKITVGNQVMRASLIYIILYDYYVIMHYVIIIIVMIISSLDYIHCNFK